MQARAEDRRWRIGELASATGLTVRTLHHYEQVGLLAAAQRTAGNQRLYDARDVQRLYRIRALRDLGLSLGDVRRTLERGGALREILRAHLTRVDAELGRLRALRVLLERAATQAARGVEPDTVLATIEAMSRVARRVAERPAKMSRRDRASWNAIARELRACIAARLPATCARARSAAIAAQARLHAFARGDRATLDALAHLREWAPPERFGGWTPELMRYLQRAIAALPP